MSRKSIIMAVGLGLAAVCAVTVIVAGNSSEIDRHRRAAKKLHFSQQPTNLRGYFSWRYLLWNLEGRHTLSEVMEGHKYHMERLVALGYLEKRTVKLDPQAAIGNWVPQVVRILQQDPRLRDQTAEFSVLELSKEVTITAQPERLRNWEELLRQFDATNRVSNKTL